MYIIYTLMNCTKFLSLFSHRKKAVTVLLKMTHNRQPYYSFGKFGIKKKFIFTNMYYF